MRIYIGECTIKDILNLNHKRGILLEFDITTEMQENFYFKLAFLKERIGPWKLGF